MYTRRYNFHDFLTIVIHTRKIQYIRYFDNEFGPYKTEEVRPDNDIEVFIDIDFPHNACREPLFFSYRFKQLFKVSYCIYDINGKTTRLYFNGDYTIFFYPPLMGAFVQTEVLEPLIYYKCALKNCLLIHSACVSDGSSSYLFPAVGGSGKTTLSLLLVQHGMIFLSDDLTFLSRDGVTYAYPRPLHLFTYNIKEPCFLKIPTTIRYIIKFKDVIRYFLNIVCKEKFLIATRVDIHSVVRGVKIGKVYPLSKIFFLSKEHFGKIPLDNTLIIDTYLHRILNVGEIRNILINRLLACQDNLKSIVLQKEKEIMYAILTRIKALYSINSHIYNKDNICDLINLMNE